MVFYIECMVFYIECMVFYIEIKFCEVGEKVQPGKFIKTHRCILREKVCHLYLGHTRLFPPVR